MASMRLMPEGMQSKVNLEGTDDNNRLTGGCSETQLDLCLHFCFPCYLDSAGQAMGQ